MIPHTCFFEDGFVQRFHPLTLTRPIFDLRIGIYTIGQKWNIDLGIKNPPGGIVRDPLKNLFNESKPLTHNESSRWINSRFFPTKELSAAVKNLKINTAISFGDQLIAAHVDTDTHKKLLSSGITINSVKNTVSFDGPVKPLENIWQIFQFNGAEIKNDIKRLNISSGIDPARFPHSTLINRDQIYIEEGVIIEPGAVLMAGDGPIYIGKNARIMANSVVRGPAAICENSIVKMGAKIYGDTTVGPVCKVGGEVSNVVFHSYTNKAHEGYAGNSVFGAWCNIGADTNISNLKNNYSTVRFRDWKSGEQIDTGEQFIGTIMGDHSKTGINAMLNTGTLCGVCCNLFSGGYPPKYIPSFSWVSDSKIVPYKFDKAVEAMERMMERRDVILTPAYKKMMESIFTSAKKSQE